MNDYDARMMRGILQRLDKLEVETIPMLRGQIDGATKTAKTLISGMDKRIEALAERPPIVKKGLLDSEELAERNRLAAELEERLPLPVTLHNWQCVIDLLADISPAFRATLSKEES